MPHASPTAPSALLCPTCGGPAHEVAQRALWDVHAIERRRRCVLCGDIVSTFEVLAGTVITWQVVDDDSWAQPPALRAKHIDVLNAVKRARARELATLRAENAELRRRRRRMAKADLSSGPAPPTPCVRLG